MSDYNPRDARFIPDAPIPVGDVAASAPTQPAPAADGGLTIEKKASALDRYDGGLKVLRDASAVEGGIHGHVNTANFTRTITGYKQVSFEWATLSIMDNHAAAGENVALYAQGNAYGTGPTWGICTSVVDHGGQCSQAMSAEFDVFVKGPDNGRRFGAYVVLGPVEGVQPEKPVQGYGASVGYMCEAHPGGTWTRGMQFLGRYLVGIDTSQAGLTTALRLKQGQQVAFDEFDSFTLRAQDGRVQFCAYGRPVFEIDMATGDTYRMGAKA